jgi:hypothetical protein
MGEPAGSAGLELFERFHWREGIGLAGEEQTREQNRLLVAGTTVSDITLLSTDYCNHLSEVVMIISMTADLPALIKDAKSWRPKTYAEHFEGSGLSIGPLAIQSYEISEDKFRQPFDNEVLAFNARVASACEELASVIDSDDGDYIAYTANALSQELQEIMNRIAAIANGAILDDATADDGEGGMTQDDIDDLF